MSRKRQYDANVISGNAQTDLPDVEESLENGRNSSRARIDNLLNGSNEAPTFVAYEQPPQRPRPQPPPRPRQPTQEAPIQFDLSNGFDPNHPDVARMLKTRSLNDPSHAGYLQYGSYTYKKGGTKNKKGTTVRVLPDGLMFKSNKRKPLVASLVYNKDSGLLEVKEPKSVANQKNGLFERIRENLRNSAFANPNTDAYSRLQAFGEMNRKSIKRSYKQSKYVSQAQKDTIKKAKEALYEKYGIVFKKGMKAPPMLAGRTMIGDVRRHNYKVDQAEIRRAQRKEARAQYEQTQAYKDKRAQAKAKALAASKRRQAERREDVFYPQEILAQRSRVTSNYY